MAPNFKNLYTQKQDKVKTWNPSLMAPVSGQISSSLNSITQTFLQEVSNNDPKLIDYLKMARKDPLVRSCIELKCLRAALMLGKYSHEDAFIERWVQENFDGMRGSLTHIVGRLASAMALGFSGGEIVFTDEILGQWRLKNINILDQTRISFEGKNGEIFFLRYRESTGKVKKIPYPKIIHVVNGFSSNIGEHDMVYGDPESGTAYQYYKAKQAILTEMMISAKNSASGMWLGKADSNETVQIVDSQGNPRFNSDGTPMVQSAVHALAQQLLNLENNSVLVTDNKNQVMPLIPTTKEATWQMYITILENGIMKSYGIPEMTFREGVSFSNLSRQKKTILDAQIESVVAQIRDQLVEKIVKPLLIWNFGVTKNFGTFKMDEIEDQESISLRVQNIISAVSSQILPAQNINIQNALYDSLGLPTVTKEESQTYLQEQLLKSYYENQVYQGVHPMLGTSYTPPPDSSGQEPSAVDTQATEVPEENQQ
jgi:hypothetical protein